MINTYIDHIIISDGRLYCNNYKTKELMSIKSHIYKAQLTYKNFFYFSEARLFIKKKKKKYFNINKGILVKIATLNSTLFVLIKILLKVIV